MNDSVIQMAWSPVQSLYCHIHCSNYLVTWDGAKHEITVKQATFSILLLCRLA